MPLPPTFTIGQRSIFHHLSNPSLSMTLSGDTVLPHDILSFSNDEGRHILRVVETYYRVGHSKFVLGYLKTWDNRGRLVRKGLQQRIHTVRYDRDYDYIGHFDF